jgi:hypothetical protein
MSNDGLGDEAVGDEPGGARSTFPGEASPRALAATLGEFHQALPPPDGVGRGELLPAPPPMAAVVRRELLRAPPPVVAVDQGELLPAVPCYGSSFGGQCSLTKPEQVSGFKI